MAVLLELVLSRSTLPSLSNCWIRYLILNNTWQNLKALALEAVARKLPYGFHSIATSLFLVYSAQEKLFRIAVRQGRSWASVPAEMPDAVHFLIWARGVCCCWKRYLTLCSISCHLFADKGLNALYPNEYCTCPALLFGCEKQNEARAELQSTVG